MKQKDILKAIEERDSDCVESLLKSYTDQNGHIGSSFWTNQFFHAAIDEYVLTVNRQRPPYTLYSNYSGPIDKRHEFIEEKDVIRSLIIVDFFIDAGINLSKKDLKGNNVLHKIVSNSRDKERIIELVDRLLNGGINIEGKNFANHDALFLAIQNKNYRIAEFLLGKGAIPNKKQWFKQKWEIFERALEENYFRTAEVLLKQNYFSVSELQFNNFFEKRFSALYRACALGRVELAKMLLDCGVNPDQRIGKMRSDKEGKFPAFAAAEKSHYNIIYLLANYGADLEATAELKVYTGGYKKFGIWDFLKWQETLSAHEKMELIILSKKMREKKLRENSLEEFFCEWKPIRARNMDCGP